MPKTANKISFLVDQQLPDFINEEYELFGKFVQKYYEQSELQGQPVDIITNLQAYRDIDFYEQNILTQNTTSVGLIQLNDTAITVSDASSFPKNGGYVKIDDEIIFYQNRTDTELLNLSRGVSGNTTLGDLYSESNFVTTQAAQHHSGSVVHNISNLFLYAIIKSFENEYLIDFPEEYLNDSVDKRSLIKYISSFYQSKGTEKSIKFLFKCLIKDDPEPTVAYPRDFTLKSSESNWVNNYSLKVKILSGNPLDLIGKSITQNISSGNYASAVVDNVRYAGKFDGEELYEIILNEASVNGEFSIASRTKLRVVMQGIIQEGRLVRVESTLGWGQKGEFNVGSETITFEEKTVNTFLVKTRTGTGDYPVGTPVTYGANVSGANVTMLVYGVLYNTSIKKAAPYSNPGDILEISEPGFTTTDIRIFDNQNNLRWELTDPNVIPHSTTNYTSLGSKIEEFENNISAIYEDGEGYYIASSGWPSHDIISAGSTIPNDVTDQKNLKIIRKNPISTTEIYETKYRDVGIAVNGIPFLGYKDEDYILDGPIENITISSKGYGFKNDPFVLIDGLPNRALSVRSGETVESITVTNPGSYTSVPTVEILSGRNAVATAIVTNGVVTSIVVNNPGEYYSTPPIVRINDSAGKGRFAEYTSTIDTAGAVTGFIKINGGDFYTKDNISVDLISVGSGATGIPKVKEWRKDKYFINKNKLDSENGFFFQNFDPSKGHGYAYYASPTTLRANDTGSIHSPILGFAYDGNPIYGAYGYTNALDASSAVTQMSSSYTRNSGRLDGPSVVTYPIGTFINDYVFTDGSGTLDHNNGRFCVTPEYPQGTYAYFITVDSSGDPLFPYILGENYYSLPLDSNYNSNISQNDVPLSANRLRSLDISKNGVLSHAVVKDVSRGTVTSASVNNSDSNFTVGGQLVINNEGTDGFNAAGEIESVEGLNVTSIESQATKALYIELSNTAYLFDGDTLTQANTGATGIIVGDVFAAKKFALRSVTGTFNSTDVLSSNTTVINLILDQKSSYSKSATLRFSDGVNAPVATGQVLETTNDQNSVKIKVLTGSFIVSGDLFLTSSDLINTTGSKIVSIGSLSDNLIPFNVQDNVAILTTSSTHGVALNESIDISINPDDNLSTTTHYVRKRIYQEAILKNPVIATTLNDTGVGRVNILNGGGDYTTGEYPDIALLGGTGSGAKAKIIVSSAGLVNNIIITEKGSGYSKYDILSVSGTALSKGGGSTEPELQLIVDHVGFSSENLILTVDNADKITVGDKLEIGSEIVTVNTKSGTNLTVYRGVAVDHFDGASISVYNFGYNFIDNHPVGSTNADPKLISYDSSIQKAVFAWDYDQTLSSINDINLSTVFYDNSVDKKLVEIISLTEPGIYFEFSSDNSTFVRNPVIDIKEYYRYKFDTTHSSMIGVGFDISPSKSFNLVTPERIIEINNNWVDIKLGFGSRVSTNQYKIREDISYRKYYYYDRDGIVNSESSYFNVVNDPLQGEKTSLYVTLDKILYSTGTKASHDGTGDITYISKSLFSVGKISSIKITNIGRDYKKIPVVTGIYDSEGNVNTTTKCFLKSIDIGIPRNITIENNGGSYHNDLTIKSNIRSNYILIVSDSSGNFSVGETVVQRSGANELARARVTSWREGSNVLVVDRVTGILRENLQIIGLAKGNTATIEGIDYTEFNPVIKTYFDNLGKYTSDYGKLSDSNQKLHDSFYYQDYSYLVRSKTPINTWRSLIKETTHPAGFQLFGEVVIESTGQVAMSGTTSTSRASVLELGSGAKITVQSTKKQITQYLVSTQTNAVETGVGSISIDTTNTTEIKAKGIKITPDFDGALSNKGNLSGRTTFNIIDYDGNIVVPYNNQALLVTLDGIFQEPGVAYTISGSQITFAQPPLGATVKDGQSVPGVRFYGKHYQFKNDTYNAKYLRKIRNIFQKNGRWIDAANQLERNKEYIQSESLGHIKNKYNTLKWGTLERTCYRDIGYIVDALSHDLRFGGNQSTVESIQKYFNNDILDFITGELQETIEAYEYAVELAKLAVNNQLPVGTYTTVEPYANTNIIVDSSDDKCEDVISALSTLSTIIRTVFTGGVGVVPISYPDYIDGKNTTFELYYEDGTGVSTENNEDLLIGISGVIQHDSAYSIDRTSVPNKVVFTSPPLWGQEDNTKTLQEPLAVDKFFAHSIGSYFRCEIDTQYIPSGGSNGPFLIKRSSDKTVVSITDQQFVLVFVDGIWQRYIDSYTINESSITFSRNLDSDSKVEIICIYGRDISQSISLYDFERNQYYNELTLICDAGSANDFTAWKQFNPSIAYQKDDAVKKIIGSIKDYSTTGQELTVILSGRNPDFDNTKNVFFTSRGDFSDEYELTGTTNTLSVNNDYRLQRNSSKWLYGSKRADEAFYVKKGLANLNTGDLIKISGEDEYRTINELPQYLNTKTYIPGDDPSQNFFGSAATTNYNGEQRGTGLSVTCTVSGGKVNSITWDKNVDVEGYETAPILHFVPVNKAGGGARAEVIIEGGTVIDIVLTDTGSGYTEAPRIIVAKQYDLIKGNRKIDPFCTLIITPILGNVALPGPIYMSSETSFETGVGSGSAGAGGAGGAIVGDASAGLKISDTLNGKLVGKITVIIDSIGINTSSTLAIPQELVIFHPSQVGSAGATLAKVFKQITHIQTGGIVRMGIPFFYFDADGNRRIGDLPSGGGGGGGGGGVGPGDPGAGKITTYELGFVDHRYYNPSWNPSAPPHLHNMTMRPSFFMWENAKFMDTGNIVDGTGLGVSALTIDEMTRWGYDLADFADNAMSGVSDAGYAFNVGYPSINYYLGQLQTSDLPDENGGGYLATNAIVYVESTSSFPATGTILIGREQISYTSKLSDRFIGCTRGVNGSPVEAHSIEDYFRSA